ncbi:UNVERIFIED_CONTAM: hypothetical protein FKN15_058532 [Acipenser sinensis]
MNMDKVLMPSVTLIVGCGVSSLTLLLLIIIYVSVWRYIRSERSVILINFCLSIISSNALILIGQTQTRNKVNMVIGILVFNKLVSKDGITDKKLKERAGYA